MSGFIGTLVMFNMINFAFSVELNMRQKKFVLNAILPLSEKTPTMKEIKIYVKKINVEFYNETKIEREKFEVFLTNYLFNNIGNMV
ncbi:hypothetical protein LS68_003860 [Helicobacter sp. MIT 05-5293]|uniref:hypothetical protein n=1 Tax=Helicobacter sp. MIT 05-5293 TaxID=1548149 RepID=UPI00051D1E9A|nr:hypothetical protein [Helicobacter sp. MIT 05-5293]TLD82142.1 hypothetical protein LS68_003860 [Helicobacter sp. MIT 05-5293]